MTWREDYADQNLRMAQKMLEQQGELNEARAQVAAAMRVVAAAKALVHDFAEHAPWNGAGLYAAIKRTVDEFDQKAPQTPQVDAEYERLKADYLNAVKRDDVGHGDLAAENVRLRSVVKELLRFGEVAQAWRSFYVPEIDARNEHLFRHELPLIRAVDRAAGLGLVWVDGRLVDVRLPDEQEGATGA